MLVYDLIAFQISITLSILGYVEAKESTPIFTSSEAYFNKLYIQDHRIVINPGNVSLDIIMNVAKDYPQDPWSEVNIHMKNRKTNRYRSLFAFDNNVCQLLGSGDTQFLTIWVQSYLQLGNKPISCPIKKGNYSWHGLKLDNLNIPQLFQGKYKITVSTYFRKKSVKDIITNVNVTWELK